MTNERKIKQSIRTNELYMYKSDCDTVNEMGDRGRYKKQCKSVERYGKRERERQNQEYTERQK